MAKSDFPMVPKLLIEALEKSFRDTIPDDPTTSLDAFRLVQGNQQVIRFLRHQYDKQTAEILEK